MKDRLVNLYADLSVEELALVMEGHRKSVRDALIAGADGSEVLRDAERLTPALRALPGTERARLEKLSDAAFASAIALDVVAPLAVLGALLASVANEAADAWAVAAKVAQSLDDVLTAHATATETMPGSGSHADTQGPSGRLFSDAEARSKELAIFAGEASAVADAFRATVAKHDPHGSRLPDSWTQMMRAAAQGRGSQAG